MAVKRNIDFVEKREGRTRRVKKTGWKRKDGTIHYEFGGENYTAKQFIKDYS